MSLVTSSPAGRRVASLSVRLFLVLTAFGFGWFLLVLAGVESPAYEAVLSRLNAPVAAFADRTGLAGANDAVGFVVFVAYYYLLALGGAALIVGASELLGGE